MRYQLAIAAITAILVTSAVAQVAIAQPAAKDQATSGDSSSTAQKDSRSYTGGRFALDADGKGAAAPTTCDHAINTKGTGATNNGRTTESTPTPVDPKNSQQCLKTKTKSNQSND
jgi:hypothetical protein